MSSRSASKTFSEYDTASEASTDCDCGRCSSTGSTPFGKVDSSKVTEVGSTIWFLPNSVEDGVVIRNTFVDYVEEEQKDLLSRTARRTSSAPPAPMCTACSCAQQPPTCRTLSAPAASMVTSCEQPQVMRTYSVPVSASSASSSAVLATEVAAPVKSERLPTLLGSEGSSDASEAAPVGMPRGALATLGLLKRASERCGGGGKAVAVQQGSQPTPPASLLSLGSAAHGTGDCRPCGFYWKARGCSNGSQCEFCHICDGEERKRRQRNRKIVHKAKALRQLIPAVSL
eukprot:TRINITY_DN80932_c0_g1_i1.p1 TRINITY_DN80932_c0_g1~~TRINITY_DN80932_c0_g1_i1.p1  ORF type:complete len:286 (-),score=48.29 TRINITY_DN80932_c0_g1_i1:561-1418(-)